MGVVRQQPRRGTSYAGLTCSELTPVLEAGPIVLHWKIGGNSFIETHLPPSGCSLSFPTKPSVFTLTTNRRDWDYGSSSRNGLRLCRFQSRWVCECEVCWCLVRFLLNHSQRHYSDGCPHHTDSSVCGKPCSPGSPGPLG